MTIDHNEISELFARDPISHTDAEVDKMIEYYRTQRGSFHLGNNQAGSKNASRSKPKPKIEVDISDIL